jgi:MOSC domain-containing protein YiiM
VYVYGLRDYAWWSQALGCELAPGTFGENLTIAGLESARFRIGDRLHAGAAILEVSAPRIPCSTLAARMGDPLFAKRFRYAERPGLYCRVIVEGPVQAGDTVTVEPYTGETLTIAEMFRDSYDSSQDEATIRRHLAAPIAARDRAQQEERLARLLRA